MSFVSYAQNFEDVMLRRVFHDVAAGFYVDIGAWEPELDSVTKALYDAGWHGINIEPGPVFARLAAARPRDINLQVAIGAQAGRATLQVHHANDAILGTSTLKSAPLPQIPGAAVQVEAIEVEVRTLAQVLDQYAAGQHIHVLKIDAEGAELDILQDADWQRHRPELLVIEATRPHSPERNDAAWAPLLAKAGYHAVWFDGLNAWFLREESMARATAFQLPPNVFDGFRVYDHEATQRLARSEAWGRSLEADLLKAYDDLDRAWADADAMQARYASLEQAHAILQTEMRALLKERWRLTHRLEMPSGPRLLRMVLPPLRVIRRLVRRGRGPDSMPSDLASFDMPAPPPTDAGDHRLERSIEAALLTLALRRGQPLAAKD